MKNFSILLLLLLSISSNSQKSDIPVQLKTKTIYFPLNLDTYISTKIKEKTVQERYYKLVQFTSIPSQDQKEKMIKLGMRFQEYIPQNTYLVSFPSNFDKKNLKAYGVSSIVNLTEDYRITNEVKTSSFPEWAMEEDKVLLYLSFHKDLDFSLCLEQLNSGNITIKIKDVFSKKVVVSCSVNEIKKLLKIASIRLIDLVPEPGKPEHELSRNMHRSSSINTWNKTGRKYDGTGVVVAVNDDGIVGPHIDFKGRMTQPGVVLNIGNHGDMVAGIIGGTGNLNPTMRGMATGCDIVIRQYNSSLPNTVTVHLNDSAVIFNSSYSNGCNSGYTTLASKVDQEIRLNPTLIQIFSAGNSNNNSCGYGAGTQWGNITGGHKQAKNVIATANLENDMSLADSSSRGPAADGRIKPDIAAHGNGNYSTNSNNTYLYGSGTSAASPSIAGVMAQLYHAHKINYGTRPKSGLMKAILLNTAEDFGNTGPDFKYGWGRVNALKAVKAIEEHRFLEDSITNSSNKSHLITIPANVKEAKIMVYWTDYEGSTSASKALVNDLDITMELGFLSFSPWNLDPAKSAPTQALKIAKLNTPSTRGVDTLNNVEQVSITTPTPGIYTLKVTGTSVPQGPQQYFVTYDFVYDSITLINPNGGEGFVPGTTERIFWDAYDTSASFTLKLSTDSGTSWTTIGTANANARYFDWTVPSTVTSKAILRIEKGSLFDLSDHTFSIINTPTNLSVDTVCTNFMKVSWNPVSGADQYEIYLLGNKFMDSVGRTTKTSFRIQITNPYSEQWFSVAAVKNNSENNIGRRANAVYYAGGRINCPLQKDVKMISIDNLSKDACISGSTNITITIKNDGSDSIKNIPVKYQINSSPIETDTIKTLILASNNFQYNFTKPHTFTTGINTIKVWAALPADQDNFNDTLEKIFIQATPITAPFTENFNSFSFCALYPNCESIKCDLKNDFQNLENLVEDDIDWRANSGPTNSSGTGPSGDHTSGFGKYLYIEASGGCTRKNAILYSPCIYLPTSISSPTLTFWYHMYGGSTVDTLSADIYDGVNWQNSKFKIGGNQDSTWKKASIDLTSYSGKTIKLRFNGRTGGNYDTDIAIDDINISTFVGINENDIANSISIYPNPNHGEFTLKVDSHIKNPLEISIYDIYGILIYTNTFKNQLNKIKLESFSAGVYTIKLKAKSQNIIKKIILN